MERRKKMNKYFPLYFFFSFFPFSHKIFFPCILFLGLYFDKVLYNFPFLHTILFTLFYGIVRIFPPPRNRKKAYLETTIFLSIYFFVLYLYTQNFSFSFFIIQILWNGLMISLLFKKGRIYVKKRK